MALIWLEGFENYNNKDDLNAVDSVPPGYTWNDDPQFGSAYGRNGRGMRLYDQTDRIVISDLGKSLTTVIMGFAWKASTIEAPPDYHATRGIIEFWDYYLNTCHLRFSIVNTWIMQVHRGNGTYLGQSSVAISNTGWQYIEVKAYIHDTAGTVEIRFNEQTVLTLSGIDTKNSGNALVRSVWLASVHCGTYSDIFSHYDDWYICDATGSECNDFLGDVRVDISRPNGAGSSTQFTPSAGSNYQNVDETVPDDDTTYNHSDTVGHKDLYAMGNLGALGTDIYGLKTQTTVRKTDATGRFMKPVLKSGTTEVDGSEIALSTSYRTFSEMFQDDPDTSSAWTESGVNAIEAGAKVTV